MRATLTGSGALAVVGLLVTPSTLWAQGSADPAGPGMLSGGFTVIDWVVLALYAAGVLGLGFYYSRKQTTSKEYFVGSGNISPILIGVSLFATLLSTISYLAVPGESLAKGPALLVTVLAQPIAFVVVGYVLIPVFMRQRVTSAYELLEAKLGLGPRLLGAIMFIALRLVWMSVLIYFGSQALLVMLDLPQDALPIVVLVTGTVALVYTSLGGLRAVVITDFIQASLLFGGAVLTIGIVTYALGGFSWVPTEWDPNWDTQPIFSFNPATRATVIMLLINFALWQIATAGGDQTAVQRFMATRDAKAARQSYGFKIIAGVLVSVTLVALGFAMLAYFNEFPDQLPDKFDLRKDGDKIYPWFIGHMLPPGISGLVAAALFAAAMSSIDSGVNSITAVVTTDFLDRAGLRPESEKAHTRMAQGIAFAIGVVIVIGSSFVGEVPGNIFAVTQRTTNLLVTPIFALFVFALFIPFARPVGVYAGTAAGITTAIMIAFSGPLVGTVRQGGEAHSPVSFLYIGVTALTVNLVVGCVVSLVASALSKSSEAGPTSDD